MSARPLTPGFGRGLFHLGIVYLVWSSTYLAIRVAVRPGAGFPPFSLATLRSLLAFPVLLLWAWLLGRRLWPSRRELALLAGSGILLWTFGNALVVVAEQRIDSALAALLIASTPIWVALQESVLDRRAPSPLMVGALLVGFAGVGLVGYPAMRAGAQADVWAVVALLAAAFSWAAGSLLQRRRPVELDPLVSAAYQMLFGGLGTALMAILYREPLPTPSPTAWLAFAFLLVFGSLISFTSFLKALRLLPTRVVFTYGYVNPVLATLLGWLILGERLPGVTLLGGGLVLLGVAGAFRARD
jgi:drug/metabolite transporter (DMT)-like permease